jgi:hypothetical protein
MQSRLQKYGRRRWKHGWADRSDLIGLRAGAITFVIAVLVFVVGGHTGLWGWLIAGSVACVAAMLASRNDRQTISRREAQRDTEADQPE